MKGRLVPSGRIDGAMRDAMFDLLTRWFEGVSPQRFDADLADKSHAILLEENGDLAGFSTLDVRPVSWNGDEYHVVYSGDTVVDPSAWSRSILPAFWIRSVWSLCPENRSRLLWLLLTSGYRTYRFLPVFWREFHPRCKAEMPSRTRRLRDFLAFERYGDQYDPHAGVVRFSEPQRLRRPLADIPRERARNPHVAFFAESNPGHARGDELVCLTALTPQNLTPAGQRVVEVGHKLSPEPE